MKSLRQQALCSILDDMQSAAPPRPRGSLSATKAYWQRRKTELLHERMSGQRPERDLKQRTQALLSAGATTW
jgi:hypothetical protein